MLCTFVWKLIFLAIINIYYGFPNIVNIIGKTRLCFYRVCSTQSWERGFRGFLEQLVVVSVNHTNYSRNHWIGICEFVCRCDFVKKQEQKKYCQSDPNHNLDIHSEIKLFFSTKFFYINTTKKMHPPQSSSSSSSASSWPPYIIEMIRQNNHQMHKKSNYNCSNKGPN